MKPAQQVRIKGSQEKAFTLIEILVVVAIIALLVSILMPAMKSARETSKSTVCLSNLKQQGTSFATYSKDSKQYLPYGGYGKYPLIDGGYHNLVYLDGKRDDDGTTPDPGESNLQSRWVRQGNGVLYPRYTGNSVDLFYCPSNTDAGAEGERGKSWFLKAYRDDTVRDPVNLGPRDYRGPLGAYAYGLPLSPGKCPRDGTKVVYSDESMTDYYPTSRPPSPLPRSAYYNFLWDAGANGNSWIGSPLLPARSASNPSGPRGTYPVQALLVDAYFSGYTGFHINGWNVLYSDFHAKRVGDPLKKIKNAGGSPYTYQPGSPYIQFAWDYMSRNP